MKIIRVNSSEIQKVMIQLLAHERVLENLC
jgi:hypothetical protein